MKNLLYWCVLLVWCLAFAGVVAPSPAKAVFQCGLRTQGYVGGCDNIYVRWFDNRSAISYQLRYSDGYTVTVPGSRQDHSRTGVGCGWGGQITITGTYGTGGTCTAFYSGALPHNRPCEQCSTTNQPVSIQNAANGRSYAAPGSIVAAYGSGISTVTEQARSLPLPLELGGVRVFVGLDGERQCQLFYVSPNQVNFQVPSEVGVGLQQVKITNASGQRFTGDVFLVEPAPGVFTRDGTGSGAVAADWYPWGVSLYATGINPALLLPGSVRVRTRGIEYLAQWAGYAPGFVGLVQINVPLPASALGSGASLFVGSAESQGFILTR